MTEGSLPAKTFVGVRFLLLGFDPFDEHQVRSKLVDCGGEDVAHYSPNCTHVIVDKIVYDDPVCVAARNDAKTLVTALWVHHSFDVGLPIDPTWVSFFPLSQSYLSYHFPVLILSFVLGSGLLNVSSFPVKFAIYSFN
ncbi:hypothetical protein ACFX2C_007529 [Malus domestica]